MWFNLGAEELFEAAVTVPPAQPFGRGIGVLLVWSSCATWECPAPKRRMAMQRSEYHGCRAFHIPERRATIGLPWTEGRPLGLIAARLTV